MLQAGFHVPYSQTCQSVFEHVLWPLMGRPYGVEVAHGEADFLVGLCKVRVSSLCKTKGSWGMTGRGSSGLLSNTDLETTAGGHHLNTRRRERVIACE